MKKIVLFIICFFALLLSVSVFSSAVQAEDTHTNVTGTLISPKPSASNTDRENQTKNKTLPATGEKNSLLINTLGFSFLLISGEFWYFEILRKKNYDKEI